MTYLAERGEEVCAARWEVIAAQAQRRRRRLPSNATILDLGAAEGYFSLRWAETFGETVVACDPCQGLLEMAQAHPDLPLIICRTPLTEGLLWELGRCEHVDLTLCMNILHHFGAGWDQALAATLTLGDRVLFETPDPRDTGACGRPYVPEVHCALEGLPTTWIARPPSHTSQYPRWMGWLNTPRITLQQSYWAAPPGASRPGSIFIYREGGRKYAVWPRKQEKRRWIPGINLATYLALEGAWPTREALAACAIETVAALPSSHGDITPWNWIVTGAPRAPLQLIDYHDFTSDDVDGLTLTLAAIGGGR